MPTLKIRDLKKNNLMIHLRVLAKEEQAKLKISRRKERIKV
jgi:hypothetical protein